jgi:hypothetical protein
MLSLLGFQDTPYRPDRGLGTDERLAGLHCLEGTPHETSVDFFAVERVSCTPTVITCTEEV